jgi:hypothetical protein
MNTGQTILTIGAIVLMGLTVISVNSSSLQHGAVLMQTKIGVYAISLAQSTIEDASGKAFDEASVISDIPTDASGLALLTAYNALGPEENSTFAPPLYVEHANDKSTFDDFDDFNNFRESKFVAGVDTMKIVSTVMYIDPANPDGSTNTKFWDKKINVKVWRPSYETNARQDTVKMSYIFSYWIFR